MNYNTTKRIDAVSKQVTAEKALKQRNKEYDELTARYNALRNMNEEQDKIIKDLLERFDKGGIIYTVNGNHVTNVVYMPEISLYTYYQELDNRIIKYINTPLYAKIPFVKVIDREIKVDENEYKKFLGGIL